MATDTITLPECVGCGVPTVWGILDPRNPPICMDCVKARARAVVRIYCGCRAKRRKVSLLVASGRRWKACGRCLGVVRE